MGYIGQSLKKLWLICACVHAIVMQEVRFGWALIVMQEAHVCMRAIVGWDTSKNLWLCWEWNDGSGIKEVVASLRMMEVVLDRCMHPVYACTVVQKRSYI